MEKSRFADLPAELRNEIWELALTQGCPIKLKWNHTTWRNKVASRDSLQSNMLALPRTCKAIRDETALLFFHINTFEFVRAGNPDPTHQLSLFSRQIGKNAFSAVSSIIISASWISWQYNTTLESFVKAKALAEAHGIPKVAIGLSMASKSCEAMGAVINPGNWVTSWKKAEEIWSEPSPGLTTHRDEWEIALGRLLLESLRRNMGDFLQISGSA